MNIKPTHRAALAAANVLDSHKIASLRSAAAFGGVDVDFANGIIRNVAVITIGPAEGHGFSIDRTTLEQVCALAAAKPNGVQNRFKHPESTADGIPVDMLGKDVGYVRNLRIEGNSVRGDVYLEDYAEVLPGIGNAKEYLLRKAKSDPAGIGLSAVIGFDVEETRDAAGNITGLVARVSALDAIDFVGRPAANPNGLLSALAPVAAQAGCSLELQVGDRTIVYTGQTPEDVAKLQQLPDQQANAGSGESPAEKPQQHSAAPSGAATLTTKGRSLMDPKMKQCLQAHFGLAADATDDAAQTYYDGLSADKQADVKTKMAQMAAKTADGAQNVAQLAASTHEAMLAAEGKRVVMLTQLGEALRLDKNDADDAATVNLAIASGDDVPAARTRYLKRLQDKCKPVEGLSGVRVGDDRNLTSLRTALPQALLMKIGTQRIYKFDHQGRVARDAEGKPVLDKIDDRSHELASLRMREILREHVCSLGVDNRDFQRLSDGQLVKLFTRRGVCELFPRVAQLAQGVDDFDSALANVQNKALRIAYVEMSATWTMWCSRRTTDDFKTLSDVQMSEAPNLQSKDEHGRYRRVQISDSKETWSLAEYGIIIAITRRAALNDDLNVFAQIPTKQAAAARRLEETQAYSVLTANAAMVSDSIALFDLNTHKNLDSATANVGAPSVTTLGLGRKSLRVQTGPKGSYLNLIPKFLLVPAALENVAEQYTSANYVAAVQTSINPFAGTGRTPLVPIVQPRLDANSATAWYMAADPTQIDTVKLCFLSSEPEPSLSTNEDFHTDDLELKVRHSVAATALDYRGLYKNNGA